MASIEKFLFDIAFDDELQKAAGATHDPGRRQSFSADDLAEAKSQGFAAGRTAGLEEAARSTDQAASEALAGIAGRLEELLAQRAEIAQQREGQEIETAVHLLAKLFPELARRNALDEVVALITQCLEDLREEPRVVIRTADALLDPLRDKLESLTAGAAYDGKVVLLADEALAPSDVRVEWADGGVERDTQRLWAEIDQVLERYLGQCQLGPLAPVAVASGPAAPEPSVTPAAPAADSDAIGQGQDGLMTPELEHE